jgi:hypothetical protein
MGEAEASLAATRELALYFLSSRSGRLRRRPNRRATRLADHGIQVSRPMAVE